MISKQVLIGGQRYGPMLRFQMRKRLYPFHFRGIIKYCWDRQTPVKGIAFANELKVSTHTHKLSNQSSTPLFKFGFNPSLIDGILSVLPYELAS